jgi:hypothetical protein
MQKHTSWRDFDRQKKKKKKLISDSFADKSYVLLTLFRIVLQEVKALHYKETPYFFNSSMPERSLLHKS